jgi:adenine-specific DNA-methyltransferase
MPTLNWIGKEKIVNHDRDVPFRLMWKNKKSFAVEGE